MTDVRQVAAAVGGALCGVGTLGVLVAVFVVLLAGPARAHVAGGAEPTNYRVAVTSVPEQVAVQVGVGGQWVRVTVAAGASGPVEVLGYAGEPFLRISPDGVRLNQRSAVAGDNPRLAAGGSSGSPAAPDADARPQWTSAAKSGSLAWTDDRTSTGTGRWRLPLRVDGESVDITGTRTDVPPPSPWPWVGGLLAVSVAAAVLGWRTRWEPPAAVALAAAVLASAAHLAGAALAPGPGSATSTWLSVLFTGALCWPIAAIALVLVLRRREHAPFAVAVAGAVFAVVTGPDDLAVLWRSQLPFAGPEMLERALVVVTVGLGAGLAVAGLRKLRRYNPPAVPARREGSRAAGPGGPGELDEGAR